jgi:hypothetical protein
MTVSTQLAEASARAIGCLARILQEPPFRVFVQPIVKVAPVSPRTKAAWDAAARVFALLE